MKHIRSSSVEISAQELDALRKRYPALVRKVENRYPLSLGNKYYEPQLQVRKGAVVFCSVCNNRLQYRDLRIVTRRIDASRYAVYFLERCVCRECLGQRSRQDRIDDTAASGRVHHAYHMLYPDEVVEFFHYTLDTVQIAIDAFRSEREETRTVAADLSINVGNDSSNNSYNSLLKVDKDEESGQVLLELPAPSDADLSCLDRTDEKTIHRWVCWYIQLRVAILLALSLSKEAIDLIQLNPAISTLTIVYYLQGKPHWLQKASSVFQQWNLSVSIIEGAVSLS